MDNPAAANLAQPPTPAELLDFQVHAAVARATMSLSPMTASLAFAVTFVLFWYVILDQLYRRGVFFKV